jgi:hypothetical protein
MSRPSDGKRDEVSGPNDDVVTTSRRLGNDKGYKRSNGPATREGNANIINGTTYSLGASHSSSGSLEGQLFRKDQEERYLAKSLVMDLHLWPQEARLLLAWRPPSRLVYPGSPQRVYLVLET